MRNGRVYLAVEDKVSGALAVNGTFIHCMGIYWALRPHSSDLS